MDEICKERFGGVDKRVDEVGVRQTTYLRLAFATHGTVVTLFVVIVAYSRYDLTTEKAYLRAEMTRLKDDIQRFEKDAQERINSALGLAQSAPDLEAYTSEGQPLDGREVTAQFKRDDDGKRYLLFRYILRNKGDALCSNYWIKIYCSKPLIPDGALGCTDENPGFDYEDIFRPDEPWFRAIPSKLSMGLNWTLYLDPASEPQPASYPILLKVYYPDSVVKSFRFNLLIKEPLRIK